MSLHSLISGLGFGAGLMYFFDPELGRRRRKIIHDQANHALHEINDAVDVTWHDLSNRSYGWMSELRAPFVAHDNSDRVVEARVRSKLGRYVSHPSAIQVNVREGCAALSGSVLAAEVEPLLASVKSVTGVKSVENQLDVHETSENVSALQGGRQPCGERCDILQNNWSPTTRLMVGSVAGGLLVSCAGARVTLLLGTLGLGFLAAASLGVTPPQRVGGQKAGSPKSIQAF